MALGLNFGNPLVAGDGDSLLTAFTSINNMFSTTTKLGNGDLTIGRDGGIKVGKGGGTSGGGTAIGEKALNSPSAGLDNTAVGWYALETSIGHSNTAVGSNAMKNSSSTFANSNTAIGTNALKNTAGGNNCALGFDSLKNNTSGYENVAIGFGASQANLDGYRNTAIGVLSQAESTTANFNISLGSYSLFRNFEGEKNVAIGYGALENNSIGGSNTAVGHGALSGNTEFFNIAGLGYNAQVSSSNQVQLGDQFTTPYAYQALGNRSDLRDKTEVRNTVLGLDFINELRPVDYKWDMREDYRTGKPTDLDINATEEEKVAHKILTDAWLESCKLENLTHDGTHTRTRYHHGLIAQEVQDVIQASGVDFGGFQDHKVNGGGDVLSLGYTELIAPMIKAIQELTARINVLEGN